MCQTSNHLLYDALTAVEWNEAKQVWDIVPELATSWEIPKPDTIIFKLQKGVKFHDGTDFNAEIAKWNLDRMRQEPKSWAKDYVQLISSVDVLDPDTIKLNLRSNSVAPQLAGVSAAADPVAFVSKAAVDRLGEEFQRTGAVGTGPMQFVEWRPSDYLKLKKFPNHWRKGVDGQPLPYLDAATQRVIADSTVHLLEMRSGTLDINDEVDPKDMASVRSNPDLKLQASPSAGSIKFTYGVNPNKGKFYQNLKLRQALEYSLDRESLAKVVGFGETTPHQYPFWIQGYPGWDTKNPSYDYNPDKAKQLLTEAGFPNGLEFSLTFPSRTEEQRISQVAQAMWAKVGLKVVLDGFERLAWQNKLKTGDFDATFWSGTLGPDPDQNTRNLVTGMAGNWIGYSTPQMDKCMDEGRTTPDPKARHEVYVKCQKIIYEEAIWGSGYLKTTTCAARSKVQGLKWQWRVQDFREVWFSQ
jgi:peptide/nickel transport system substrate-binding protein